MCQFSYAKLFPKIPFAAEFKVSMDHKRHFGWDVESESEIASVFFSCGQGYCRSEAAAVAQTLAYLLA